MPAAVFDTNIIIDYLNGYMPAKKLFSKYSPKIISVMTYIELLSGARDEGETSIIEALLETEFEILDLDIRISKQATEIYIESIYSRKRLELPDCIILATATSQNAILLTRNISDFKGYPNVIMPYEL